MTIGNETEGDFQAMHHTFIEGITNDKSEGYTVADLQESVELHKSCLHST